MKLKTRSKSGSRSYVKASKIAKIYDVDTKTIYEWVKRGVIPAIRINDRVLRFRLRDVQASIERRN